KESLEVGFPALWVRGEVSGLKRAESGHLYFALKEGREALIACVMWRTSASRLACEPRDGAEVEAFGGVSVYEPRGRYQLVAREVRPAGLGALLLALEELKRRLAAEGLFDAARKRALPRYPARIGLVTSPVGAAVRDLVKVLRGRWPGIGIVLAAVRVQGPGAADEIAAAIALFDRLPGVDLLIVGRGGGSLEDLWAFNEEAVVRAARERLRSAAQRYGLREWPRELVARRDTAAALNERLLEAAGRGLAERRRRLDAFADRLRALSPRLVLERGFCIVRAGDGS